MAKTSSSANDSDLLRSHDNVTFEQGIFNYQISHSPEGETYKTAESKGSVSETLSWAFGSGNNGQSYLFEHDHNWYEARMSFFRSSGTFGLTPNHPVAPADSIDKAIGRKLAASEAPKCFGCHTTASSTSGTFTPAKSIPGITCEVCHGPAATHVVMEKNGAREEGAGMVLNPAKLSPADSVDFCGACHRTWWDVNLEGLSGVGTLRFPRIAWRKAAAGAEETPASPASLVMILTSCW